MSHEQFIPKLRSFQMKVQRSSCCSQFFLSKMVSRYGYIFSEQIHRKGVQDIGQVKMVLAEIKGELTNDSCFRCRVPEGSVLP